MENSSQLAEANLKETHNESDVRRRENTKLSVYSHDSNEILSENSSPAFLSSTNNNKAVALNNLRDLSNNNNNNNNNMISNVNSKYSNNNVFSCNSSSGGGMLINQSFLTDHELKQLLTEATDGFLFIAKCDAGSILYVSDTITKILNVRQEEWYNTNLYTQIHPADVGKVKEQLDCRSGAGGADLAKNSEESRRTFVCRMKIRQANTGHGKYKNLYANKSNHCYAAIQCNGLIKKCPSQDLEQICGEGENEQYCIVATAKLQPTPAPSSAVESDPTNKVSQFISRHSFGGNFIFVDQRITPALGYTTVELLGKCFFDFFYRDDRRFIKETFKFIPTLRGKSMTVTYRFWSKAGYWIWLRNTVYAYVNPYNKEMEYIICECTVLPNEVSDTVENAAHYFNLSNRSGSSSYRLRDRLRHQDNALRLSTGDVASNSDPGNFFLADTSFSPELYGNPNAQLDTILTDRALQQYSNDWLQQYPNLQEQQSITNDWALPPVVELLPQQDNWSVLGNNTGGAFGGSSWPVQNDLTSNSDLNSTICQNDPQFDLWQFNEENTPFWPKQYLENGGNSLPQFSSSNLDLNNVRQKINWPDLDNCDINYSQLDLMTRNNNTNLYNELSPNNQQRPTWSDIDQNLSWAQNLPLDSDLTKAINDLTLNSTPTKTTNLPWKLRDDNILQLSMPSYGLCNQQNEIAKTLLLGDQSKFPPKLPDLIEQVLHVDQPFRQGTSNFEQTES